MLIKLTACFLENSNINILSVVKLVVNYVEREEVH